MLSPTPQRLVRIGSFFSLLVRKKVDKGFPLRYEKLELCRFSLHQETMRYPEAKRKPFTFDTLVEFVRAVIKEFPDKRTGNNTRFTIEDAALGAFSVFFTQSPSFLAFQKMMYETKGKSNAQSLFGMRDIPCDNHIRDLLDVVPPSYIFPVFFLEFSYRATTVLKRV